MSQRCAVVHLEEDGLYIEITPSREQAHPPVFPSQHETYVGSFLETDIGWALVDVGRCWPTKGESS